MGLNIGLNSVTSGGLFITALFLVIMGVLLVSADNKIRNIPEFTQSSQLMDAHNRIQTAYILTFVAAGVILLLAVLYAGHETWWSPSEYIHGIFLLIALALIVISAIYAYMVLNDLYTPELDDTNGSTSYLWASLLFAVISFLMTFAIGGTRTGYNMVRSDVEDRFTDIEHKIHLTHSHLTGEPVDYDKISAEPPELQGETIVMEGPPPPAMTPACPMPVPRPAPRPRPPPCPMSVPRPAPRPRSPPCPMPAPPCPGGVCPRPVRGPPPANAQGNFF
jgi:hypothetical protein